MEILVKHLEFYNKNGDPIGGHEIKSQLRIVESPRSHEYKCGSGVTLKAKPEKPEKPNSPPCPDPEKERLDTSRIVKVGNSLEIYSGETPEDINPSKVGIKIVRRDEFGDGSHPTTRMCLEALSTSDYISNASLLDFGCGTGVISICAIRLGAKNCHAIDIRKSARKLALENISENNLSDKITLGVDVNKSIGVFDVIVVNINSEAILSSVEKIKNSAGRSSMILLSGFHENEIDMIISRCNFFAIPVATYTSEGWGLIVLKALKK